MKEHINSIQCKIHTCTKCSNLTQVECGHSPNIFYNKFNKVMLIGHSPKTRTKSFASTVLNMNIKNGRLYKYIENYILSPLNLTSEDIYCTNLMKCFTKNLPEDIDKQEEGFIKCMSTNCIDFLTEEIEVVNPQLIISFSEKVLNIIALHYMGQSLKMKNSFGELFEIDINNHSYQFIPVVHMPRKLDNTDNVYKHYFPHQTEKLKLRRIDLGF